MNERKILTKLALTAIIIASASLSQAFSFAGDWNFTYDATLNYNTTLASGSEVIAGTNPVVVTQPNATSVLFDVNIGAFAGTGDFVLSGTTLTDVNGGQTTDPFDVPFGTGTITLRATYPTWTLTGEVTGSQASFPGPFGPRAYEVTGNPVTINNVQLEALLFGNWVNLGSNNNVVINSWSLNRAEAVPEPATLAVLAGAAAIVAKRRKR